jgi:AraC-like DNA-binding protein
MNQKIKVYQEITPLTSSDLFVILDSVNKGFEYPIHHHPEFELTLIMRSSGNRIVGDSFEKYHKSDLVLLGPYLFHKWDDEDRSQSDRKPCRVITIQFDMKLFEMSLLSRKPFHRIKALLANANRGIRFTGKTYEKAVRIMVQLTSSKGLDSVIGFLKLLDILARSTESIFLASEGFKRTVIPTTSKRLHLAYQYILNNFANQKLSINDVASEINLSDSAFSHFFKKYTNKNFTQFLIDMRLGYASKLLLDTDDLVGDICFKSGFNNIANFNRLFKKNHHCTPLQFRKMYQEKVRFDWASQITPGQFLPFDQKHDHLLKPTHYGTKLVHN